MCACLAPASFRCRLPGVNHPNSGGKRGTTVKVDLDLVDLITLAMHKEIEKEGVTIALKPPLLPEVVVDPDAGIARVAFFPDKKDQLCAGGFDCGKWTN